MTADGRMTIKALSGTAAALALAFSAPALAQNSDTPVDVTAAPAPSSDTIGPSQLQNFNLQGTVTRPADRPAATPTNSAPLPRSAAPTTAETSASQSVAPAAAGAATSRTATSAARPTQSALAVQPGPVGTVAPSLPQDMTAEPVAQSTEGVPPIPAALPSSDAPWSWPWVAALIALLGGGMFIAWSRRGRRRRYAGAGSMAFAGLTPEPEVRPEPAPPVAPRPDPVPPRSQSAPRPDPVPPRPSTPAPRAPADDGLVKSTALKPELNVTFAPDRAVVTEREVMLQFDVVLSNSGSAPARDVLVEAKLVPCHAGQDQEIAAFFQHPEATGDRMAGIPPFGRVALKSAVRLPLDQLHSFEVEGRKLFVPLIALNILFRSSGGEGQASASFLVGRGNDDDEKLAPFRLDLGPRIFRGLSARPHSMGLAR
jgi:hypothetical protein